MNVVDFAWQVIEMQKTILDQEREIERMTRIEEKYNALLSSSVEHSNAVIGNVLKVLMTHGVVEECQKGK